MAAYTYNLMFKQEAEAALMGNESETSVLILDESSFKTCHN